MQKALKKVVMSAVQGSNWKKLVNPTVMRGQTAYPRQAVDQKLLGIRLDYDGEITIDDIEYHKYDMQPNAGDDIPSTVKYWRNANGGSLAVMASILVKKNGTKEDVEEALKKGILGV